MIKKKVLDKGRIRRIDGGFAFIPHRFLTGGFVSALHSDQLLLYLFLVLAADRYGLSFYNYDKICSLLEMNPDQYVEARCTLIKQDLIAFDGTIFQVLKLPAKPKDAKRQRPSPLQQLTRNMLKEVAP
ncbi:MAG: hypothetical protein JRE58_09340 [Deltaproteobacteria bacterium]|nr:hypothetical protein [Deltaproteobacteria bacterium]